MANVYFRAGCIGGDEASEGPNAASLFRQIVWTNKTRSSERSINKKRKTKVRPKTGKRQRRKLRPPCQKENEEQFDLVEVRDVMGDTEVAILEYHDVTILSHTAPKSSVEMTSNISSLRSA